MGRPSFSEKIRKNTNLIEVMVATAILGLGFFPIMTFFSNRTWTSKKVRTRNTAISYAKNILDLFVDTLPFRDLSFNKNYPDFDGKNSDPNVVECNDGTHQIFGVMGANPAGSFNKGLVGKLTDDRVEFYTKIMANPLVDTAASVDKGTELVFRTVNWDRNALGLPPQQAQFRHVMSVPNTVKTYLNVLGSSIPDNDAVKVKNWDGRNICPVPNAQGLIVPLCKAIIKVRWKYGPAENKVEFESYKANLF